MSLRIRLIEWLDGVDAAELDSECMRHRATLAQLQQCQNEVKDVTAQLDTAKTQLDTVQDEYIAYQDEVQANESKPLIAYQELLNAVMKANRQKKSGNAWKLNRLSRYPDKIAETIRKEFERYHGKQGS